MHYISLTLWGQFCIITYAGAYAALIHNGVVAQLGARLNGIEKVGGSSPPYSTPVRGSSPLIPAMEQAQRRPGYLTARAVFALVLYHDASPTLNRVA